MTRAAANWIAKSESSSRIRPAGMANQESAQRPRPSVGSGSADDRDAAGNARRQQLEAHRAAEAPPWWFQGGEVKTSGRKRYIVDMRAPLALPISDAMIDAMAVGA